MTSSPVGPRFDAPSRGGGPREAEHDDRHLDGGVPDGPLPRWAADLSPPRIFCIPATQAPVVAVLRRGPSAWSHVGRWDVGSGRFEPGSWLRGTIYPQRCDLSPDGRWLAYFALKTPAPWTPGPTYIAISRLPWVHALVAWGTGGTWTQGVHFVEDRDVWDPGTPDEGDAGPVRVRSGLRFTRADTFAVERRRGWTETADTPPREPDDMWDERRVDRLRMEKARPGSDGSERLIVGGWYAAFRGSYGRRTEIRYELDDAGTIRPLEDVQWADWDAGGRLLVATRDGRLQIRDLAEGWPARVVSEHDLAALEPDPTPPPPSASRW